MSIKKISGSDPNRQYYEITGVYTGKKHVVSVRKKHASKYEERRNKYEARYIDENGNRIIFPKNSKIGAIIGVTIGLALGFTLGKLWKRPPAEIFLYTVFEGFLGGLLGFETGSYSNYLLYNKANNLARWEKWNGIELPEKIKDSFC